MSQKSWKDKLNLKNICWGPTVHPGASQVALVVKYLPAKAGDMKDTGLTPGSGGFLGGGNGNPLQYSWLENPMDRGAWQAIVHRVTELETTEVT